jgi:hypothetical protein
MINDNQPSLFDNPGARIQSEAEAFALARKHFVLDEIPEDEDLPPSIARIKERRAERAAETGLAARWSQEFGFIELHDPTTGERHDIPTKKAPAWAKWEAGKRKELRRRGVAHMLTATELEELWEEEHPKDPFVDDAFPDDRSAVTERGVVYKDYLEEED